MMDIIIKRLDRIEELLEGYEKEIFNVEELCKYSGFTKSQIYSLVHKNIIPYFKPNGKCLFFKKSEINSWLLQNKSQTISQINDKAFEYTRKKR